MKAIEDVIVAGIESALTKFRTEHADEDIYGLALVPSGIGDWVHLAIATEQRLEKCAAGYSNNLDLDARIKWLRWANPDDGWYQDTFSHFEPACAMLKEAIKSGALEEFDDRIEETLCAAIRRIMPTIGGVPFGITHGEDPEEFVYWVPKINPPEIAQQVELEFEEAREIEATIDFGRN